MGAYSYAIGAMRVEAKSYHQRGRHFEAKHLEAQANQLEAEQREAELRQQRAHFDAQMREQRNHERRMHQEVLDQQERQHREMLQASERALDEEAARYNGHFGNDHEWDRWIEAQAPAVSPLPLTARSLRVRPKRERNRLRKALAKVQYYRPAFELYLLDSQIKFPDWDSDPEYQKLSNTPPGNEARIKRISLAWVPLMLLAVLLKSPAALSRGLFLVAVALALTWNWARSSQARKARELIELARKDIDSRNAQRSERRLHQ
jgi:hypothetical protein